MSVPLAPLVSASVLYMRCTSLGIAPPTGTLSYLSLNVVRHEEILRRRSARSGTPVFLCMTDFQVLCAHLPACSPGQQVVQPPAVSCPFH